MITYDEEFHKKISQISLDHFERNLPKTGKPTQSQWTVLSTIIQLRTDNYTVVALGTGSKCIGPSKMSKNGDVLNDSHAEVICRRAFLRYLLEQIQSALKTTEKTIFTLDSTKKQFALKPEVSFHFFTTHVPCGDAAIFPKTGTMLKRKLDVDEETQDEPTLKKAKIPHELFDDGEDVGDVYRTGAKCLPEDVKNQDPKLCGELYHTVGVVRTKPGRGDPTLSVSCSDKIARWCHVGLQGALLSVLLVDEVFLTTFTIGGGAQFCETALNRAFYTRLGSVSTELISESKRIIIGQSNLPFPHQKGPEKQSCPSSIVWCKTETRPLEVAVEGIKQGVTKKKRSSKAGRLLVCKRELFSSFLDVVRKMDEVAMCNISFDHFKKLTLNQAKALAGNYQMNCAILNDGFNLWTCKDKSLTEFVNEES